MVRSLTTWLWLVDCGAQRRALDASAETTGELAASLLAHFDEVDVLRADQSALESVRASAEGEGWTVPRLTRGTLREAPWPSGTFNCISLHDGLARQHLAADDLLAALAQLHRLLTSGGWLAMASPMPRSRGIPRPGSTGISRTRLERSIMRAGFREVRCFFSGTALDRSLTLIPDSGHAIRAYESSDAMRGGTTVGVRRAVARLGLRSMLYPGYVMLARA
jgi:hypothetical protein